MQRKSLIVVGDSHTGIFHPKSEEIMAIYTRGALTMDSFSRGHSDAYKNLVEYLQSLNLSDTTLVMCVSEVDVRVHFWRDMPIYAARGMDFNEFLRDKVNAFIDRVNILAEQTKLKKIILWGAPASQLTTENQTEELPATGDNQTRNILTHMLNQTIIQTIVSRPTVLHFATPFYGMVSSDFITNTSWLRDGVHLQFGLRNYCMELLRPLVEHTAIATYSNAYETLKDTQMEYQCIKRIPSQITNLSFFRSWVQSKPISAITLNNQFGDFSLVSHLEDISNENYYHELVLRVRP